MTEPLTTEQGWRPSVGEYVLVTKDRSTVLKGDVFKVMAAYCGKGADVGLGKSMLVPLASIARIVPGGTRVPDGAECVRVLPGHPKHMTATTPCGIKQYSGSEVMFAILSVPTPDPKAVERERLEAELAEANETHRQSVVANVATTQIMMASQRGIHAAEAALKALGE